MPRKFEGNAPAEGRFIDGDERDEYAGRALKLISAQHQPAAKFGPRWVLTGAMLDTGELIAIALADNATRTTMFSAVRADLEADGADAYDPVVLKLQDRTDGGHPFWTFASATDEQIAEAAEIAATDAGDDDAPEGDEPAEPAPKRRGR